MARLFNAYVIVDWSAASKPTKGADSIWIGVLKRDVRFRMAFESHNPATRAEAEKLLLGILDDRAKRNERTLIGFDFALGFPRGLAAGLNLPGDEPWRAVWNQIDRMVKDKADNTNNRFGVGSEINRRLTGGPFPFWGVPPKDALTTLQPKRGRNHEAGDLPEYRHAELLAKGSSPVWKLYYQGSVGGQTILGIPVVRRLKLARGEAFKVWPFETGWRALTEASLDGVEAVAAEVYPSLIKAPALPGEVKDQTQVRTTAEYFAKADEAGRLGAMFAPTGDPGADVVLDAEREEGWILGGVRVRSAVTRAVSSLAFRADVVQLLYAVLDDRHAAERPVDDLALTPVVAGGVVVAGLVLVGDPGALLRQQRGLRRRLQAVIGLRPGAVQRGLLGVDVLLAALAPGRIGAVGFGHAVVVGGAQRVCRRRSGDKRGRNENGESSSQAERRGRPGGQAPYSAACGATTRSAFSFSATRNASSSACSPFSRGSQWV